MMNNPDITVIIPNINNNLNIIIRIFEVLKSANLKGEILIFDDNSKNVAVEKVEELKKEFDLLNLIVRYEEHDFYQSVVKGFENASADIIQVIDADLSHPPELVPELYRAIKDQGYDITIASRYTKNGVRTNYPLRSRIISLAATFSGKILFPEITDPTSDFFAIRVNVIRNSKLKPDGKNVLMEVLGKGRWERAKEIPFTFRYQKSEGKNLNIHTITDYIHQYVDIITYSLKHKETKVWKEWEKFIKFGIVGISGIFVNIGLLYTLTEYAGFFYLTSGIFAIETSIVTNFLLNDYWTFNQSKKNKITKKWKRFLSYQIVSTLGIVINLVIMYLLTEYANIWYIISNITGIFVVFIWNFFVNRNLTWRME